MPETEYHDALHGCLEGRLIEERRVLYEMFAREQALWDLLPNWARPSAPVEGGHEGGSI